MDALILSAKSVLALVLLIAGGAKLADLPSFAATLRLFLPRRLRLPLVRVCAGAIAIAELALGAASLSSPTITWLNPIVFACSCAFVVVSAAGYAFFRGRSCQCFGALSGRKFDLLSVARTVALLALAAIAMFSVQPASVQIGMPAKALLLTGAGFLALVTFTAARALDVSHDNLSRR
jgi:hypothetical protein